MARFFHKLELRTAALMSELMINRPYICAAQEKNIIIIINVENSCAAYYFYTTFFFILY